MTDFIPAHEASDLTGLTCQQLARAAQAGRVRRMDAGTQTRRRTRTLYLYHRADAEAWAEARREHLGVDPREVPRLRTCLRCDRVFRSRGAWNRLCIQCADTLGRRSDIVEGDWLYAEDGWE
jgi:hypothetical protein